MALEAEKRNLLLFFGLLACILIGTQMWSYTRITTAGLRMTNTGRSTVFYSQAPGSSLQPAQHILNACIIADGLDANGNASSITSSRKEGAPGLAQQTGQPEPISSSSKVGVSVTVMALALDIQSLR